MLNFYNSLRGGNFCVLFYIHVKAESNPCGQASLRVVLLLAVANEARRNQT